MSGEAYGSGDARASESVALPRAAALSLLPWESPGRDGEGAVPSRCLVVDDDAQVRAVIAKLLRTQGLEAIEIASGDLALEWLERQGEVPLIVSDIQMPGLDGIALLDEVRRRWPNTAVIMLTGVSDVKTAVACLDRGALDYIGKPALVEEVRARVAKALEKRELLLRSQFYQRILESRVRQQAQRIKELFLEGVQTLAHALEAKDAYTRDHSRRVSRYAARTALRLGLIEDRLEDIRLGAELHDIGKIGTRESVLNKPAPLTVEEFAHIAEHTLLGEKILAPLARESPVVLSIVRSHHERMDGRGFPDGLVADRIPLEARIVCVADAFDAMTSSRPYRNSLTPAEAYEELRRSAGTQFDPEVVAAFLGAFPDPGQLPLNL
ncbi:MAG TPA: HD domain-containing phosphohydrolase [Gemmatimonadales bacterium]|nr:HD domain-containing phosphohydrolase [Gemmatimonadales bacterium]